MMGTWGMGASGERKGDQQVVGKREKRAMEGERRNKEKKHA